MRFSAGPGVSHEVSVISIYYGKIRGVLLKSSLFQQLLMWLRRSRHIFQPLQGIFLDKLKSSGYTNFVK